MSAFICNDKTINRILSFLYWNKDDFLRSDINRSLAKVGFSVRNEEEIKKLGNAIRELNFKSIGERYGKDQEKNDREFFKGFNYEDEKCSIEQAYQHLRCLTYQCCEGKCDEDPLYLVLQELENSLAHSIAVRETEKLNCEWEAE